MYIPKRYGQSKMETCPFCGKQASQQNEQGVAVCVQHRNTELPDIKCLCGSYLDMRNGKYGAFFSCMKCGNINMKKALEINDLHELKKPSKTTHQEMHQSAHDEDLKEKPKEERVIRSDDPDYFD